jgi:phosphate starvation-inducible protein PhoH and related proteins
MAGTVIIGLPNIPSAIALAGYGEANLKFLSQQTGANLVLRGQELLVSGKEQHVGSSSENSPISRRALEYRE